jgi:hypothetical protein
MSKEAVAWMAVLSEVLKLRVPPEIQRAEPSTEPPPSQMIWVSLAVLLGLITNSRVALLLSTATVLFSGKVSPAPEAA